MANLMLNTYCNNDCPYCFAKHEVDLDKKIGNPNEEVSLDSVRYFIDFFKNKKYVGLLGGEPTLHSRFIEIVNLFLKEGFYVNLFSNGLYNSIVSDFLSALGNASVGIILNINEFCLKDSRSELIHRNLSKLKSSKIKNITLSLNYYILNQNTDYIFDLAEKYGIRTIRIGFSNPILGKKNHSISLEELKTQGDTIYLFLKKCVQNKLSFSIDCGSYIPCMFTDPQVKEMLLWSQNFSNGICSLDGALDVGINLDIWRCFPLSDAKKGNLKNFKSESEINSFLAKSFSHYHKRLFPLDECYDCNLGIKKLCGGGCLSRSISINKIRESKIIEQFYYPYLSCIKNLGIDFKLNNSKIKKIILANNHIGSDLVVSDLLHNYDPFKIHHLDSGNYFPSEIKVYASFINSKEYIEHPSFRLTRNVSETDLLQEKIEIKKYALGDLDSQLEFDITYDLKEKSTYLIIFYEVYYESKRIFSSLDDFSWIKSFKANGRGKTTVSQSQLENK